MFLENVMNVNSLNNSESYILAVHLTVTVLIWRQDLGSIPPASSHAHQPLSYSFLSEF